MLRKSRAALLLAVLGVGLLGAPAGAQSDQYIDSLFRTRFPASGPGAAVAVIRDGKLAHVGMYGLADVAERRPITARTNFYLASVTKPFTALAVNLLVRDGLLRYDDHVVRWLPELSGSDSSITIRHLLTHSSGLPDFYRFIDWPRFRYLDNAAVLDTTRAHPTPQFVPGTRYEYSNTGYVLLALIVQRAAGKPLGRVLAERVFAPLQMSSAVVYDDTTKRVPERARGYYRSDSRVLLSDIDALELPDGRLVRFTFLQTGQGGLFASITDMSAWVTALLDTSLVPAREKQEMFQQRIATPEQIGIPIVQGVGYGWFTSRRNDVTMLWHDGSRGGSRTAVVLVPNAQLGVVVLSNLESTDPLELVTLVVDRALSIHR